MDDPGERALTLPAVVEAGGTIGVRNTSGSKVFALGEKISFDAQAFSEICWTLFLFGQAIVNALDQRVREAVGSGRWENRPESKSGN